MLPDTWTDRLLASATLLGAVALVSLIVVNWQVVMSGGYVPVNAAPSPQESSADLEPSGPPVAPVNEQPRVDEGTRTAPSPPPSAAPKVLAITAVQGESWLEVRAIGTATGEPLFYGLLREGEKQTFDRLPVSVLVGAPEQLQVELGGVIFGLPVSAGGIAQFVATPDGIRPTTEG